MGIVNESLFDTHDPARLYEDCCAKAPEGTRIVIQATQKIEAFSELFYATVLVNHSVQLKGMLDSGSMACSISEHAVEKLSAAGVLPKKQHPEENIVLIGCGGLQTQPEGFYDLEIQLYDAHCVVPTLVVPGQHDDLILGSNVIKHVIRVLKGDNDYWNIASRPEYQSDPNVEQFLSMFTNVERWRGSEVPDKIGTVKLTQSVILLPRHEHLVWGRLPASVPMSPGSTVVVEPTNSKAMPRGVLVGRLVTPLWGDRWVPMTVVNPSDKALTLKRNCKLADVFPCLAIEDLAASQGLHVASEKKQPDAHNKHPDIEIQQSHTEKQVHDIPQQKLDTLPSAYSAGQLAKSLLELGLSDVDIDACQVSKDCKSRLTQLLIEYQDIFSKHSLDCGEVKGYTHRIHLTDDRPFRLPYRRVPPAHYQKLRQVLTDMEEKGIIRKSSSEYASPLVMVWKKDGGLRICTDFRWLNARTLKDAHPLPHQSDCLAALGGNCLFSTMDLTSGFFNIPMHEDDKKYTAFTTPLGLHEYNRMPQGLCNSPASFMRMMIGIFGDMNFTKLLCYLDDLLVFASSEDEALSRLRTVFQRLRENNLKLAPKKCYLLREQVRFLGHVINGEGVAVDPAKVEVITKMTVQDLMENDECTPSVRRIKSFLGMVFYYQHFIPNCSSIAKPLFALTAGQKRRGRSARDKKPLGAYRKLTPADWSAECGIAFDRLKTMLLGCVVLAHPDFDEPFILSVDASLNGLGAVLSQVPRGESKARPVAFASKTLSASQQKYPAHRLEFMALKWSVCEKFSHWLKGRSFTVWTDNNPLTYLLTKPKLDACEIRWVSKLASYSFDLKHLPGKRNVVADALSRDLFAKPICQRLLKEPYPTLIHEANGIEEDSVQDAFRVSCQSQSYRSGDHQMFKVACDSAEIRALCQAHGDWIDAAESRALYLTQHVQQLSSGQDVTPMFSAQELQLSQEQDPSISKVLPFVAARKRPSRRERHGADSKVLRLFKQWDKLEVHDGMLYRVTRDPVSKQRRSQYVLPLSLKKKTLLGIHDLAGHQGQDRTLSLARQRFYWPDMERDVRAHVRCCQRCVFGKSPEPAARAPLESIKSSAPMELVCMDFWSAEDSKQRSVDVLVVTDHFTKLAHAFPCANQTAKQVAKKLWDNVFCVYGFPERIHSDQGTNFESNLIAELLRLAGVAKSHTTAYHPMGNGGTERFNRTLGNMLRTLPLKEKQQWPQQIQTITFAYNATVHETTGYAPFFLMFGRVPRLPVDIMFKQVLNNPGIVDYDSYAKSLLSCLKSAMEIAQKHSSTEQQHQARQYNKRVKGTYLSVGDRVLVANRGERGKRKLADKWEDGVYTVVGANPNIHVYKIQNAEGRTRVVHRNLLLEVNFLPLSRMDESQDTHAHDQSLVSEESVQEDCDCDDDRASVSMLLTQDDSAQNLSNSRDGEILAVLSPEVPLESESTDSEELDQSSSVQSPVGAITDNPSISPAPQSDISHSPHADALVHTDPHAQTAADGLVRTRAGRVVKSVNRLIESMVQKPFLRGSNIFFGSHS